MWLLVGIAAACETSLMSQFAHPTAPPPELHIETTTGPAGGTTYTGAQVTFRSASPPSAWRRVLQHPELQPQWHPPELGTEKVERIEGTDFFQRTNITVLGAFHVKRQLIARVHWLESTASLVHTCWNAGDPAEFADKVKAWDDGSTWQNRGFGGWTITALPTGGSLVEYQVWVAADLVPTPVVKWAVTRTLPTLLNAFEGRVADLEARAAGGDAPAVATP
jgi:hypothetical protein